MQLRYSDIHSTADNRQNVTPLLESHSFYSFYSFYLFVYSVCCWGFFLVLLDCDCHKDKRTFCSWLISFFKVIYHTQQLLVYCCFNLLCRLFSTIFNQIIWVSHWAPYYFTLDTSHCRWQGPEEKSQDVLNTLVITATLCNVTKRLL